MQRRSIATVRLACIRAGLLAKRIGAFPVELRRAILACDPFASLIDALFNEP
jgi:hypothetical protein